MKRAILLVLLLAVAGCGGGPRPPRNLDNACLILNERPDIARATRQAEREWGIPVHVQLATIHQESSFVHNARTPHRYALGVIPMGRQSSAFGYSQALDGTWDDYRDATGSRRANRTDIRDATDFMGWYMNRSVERLGIAPDDARNQYLAYHEGHSGYARGSYNAKPWLLRVASRVDERAEMYERQLVGCRR
ncbi:lytic transglycosylase [Nioella sediminis]|uniref:transglycosylase SLT domain-containing protein n=1 Tax=Nioella sediminis TaxID=1912092 RepID=UPI0008FCFB32|nr:lytic transglycosylase [Nioella sediminis]TBX28227.1 lytic transglycosylase [Roseovarius sp. JS7-11]